MEWGAPQEHQSACLMPWMLSLLPSIERFTARLFGAEIKLA